MPPSATFLALTTIAMWSFLAYLGARLTHIPAFFIVGVALCISGLLGTVWVKSWKIPLGTLLIGVGGIFGYHFLYFLAYQYAPAIEASLMNYLWPLLIVLLSPLFLKGYHLHWYHLIGGLLGLAGAGLVMTGGKLSLDLIHLPGYLLMAGAAMTWACYSLLTKRLPPFPTGAVGAFCLFSGILSLSVFFAQNGFETGIMDQLDLQDWGALILLGIGPMGAAFFTWDAALKRGDPRIIGALAYLTPLMSTLILVLLGGQHLSVLSGIAMCVIVSGALIGSLDLLVPKYNKT